MTIKKTGEFKKFAEWENDLDDFLNIGDQVCEEIVDHFIGVLPPATMNSNVIQMGEPSFHVGEQATYSTLTKINEKWFYVGNCFLGEATPVYRPYEMRNLTTGEVKVFAGNWTVAKEYRGYYDGMKGVLTACVPENFELLALVQ